MCTKVSAVDDRPPIGIGSVAVGLVTTPGCARDRLVNKPHTGTRSSAIDVAIYKATQAEPVITAAVRAAAESAGGQLVDLDTRLKDPDSLRRKIEGRLRATPGAKSAEVLAGINDLVRYRIVAPAAAYWAILDATIEALRSSSMQFTAARNTWDTSDYRAVNATFVTSDGVLFEVQFHTPESRAAAAWARPFYEELRVTTDKRRRRQLYREIGLIFRDVPVPPANPTGTIPI